MNWDTFINGIVTGLSAGIGTTVGSWIINKAILHRIDEIEKKLKQNGEKK